MRLTAALLLSAAAVATPAAAQDTAPIDAPTTRGEVQNTPDAVANGSVDRGQPPARTVDGDGDGSGADGVNAGDVVVTATRRSERLSNVPVAVTAVSQDQLQNSGATDIRQLGQLAPSLLVSSTGSEANASARVRGVGTVGDNPGLESSVAVFIDGVYRSRTGSGLNDLGEVESIEVLRGPQGTLFGRNASAGLINITTRRPSFDFGGYLELTGGDYDARRAAGAVTGPIVAGKLAFRVDGVYSRRDGFLRDVVNDTDYNDRDRYVLRGQLLFQPTDTVSFRLIGDYTRRDEKCCGAVYYDTREKIDPTPGVAGDFAVNPAGNRIVAVLRSLGGVLPSDMDISNRRIANTPGRAYGNITKDYGVSGQLDWTLGAATLTSITAYREYKSGNAADVDYGNVDISYRADDGNAFRRFHTFTQEVRFQGSALGDRLDWLVGGYYSKEKLLVADNLRFGTQYGAFAACRIVATINPAAALRNPANRGCLSAAGRAVLSGTATGAAPAFGALTPLLLAGVDRLSTVNDLGDTRSDYFQDSENYAFFTHDIFKVTDTLSLTGGLRWTHEAKDFRGALRNDNTVCPAQQAALSPLLANPAVASNATLANLIGGIVTLTCTGNSTASLDALDLRDDFKDGEFTGTGVVSWKPVGSTLLYASWSRGYKAGGYNLDRTDLTATVFSAPVNADAANLRFDPEKVTAYEAGVKFTSRQFTFNAAAFRQEFSNFQLNTFNGTAYVVQNIGSCSAGLNGADQDQSRTTGACPGTVKYGVLSQGVELEAAMFPSAYFQAGVGYTYADTRYRRDLVGSAQGEPLDPALFLLPGRQLSNAPRNVVTASFTWTPPLGGHGWSALLYADGRLQSDYNTGSDLFPEKAQDGFFVVNARVGLRGPDRRISIEAWAQNIFNKNYTQVVFNAPFQGSGTQAQAQRFGTSPVNQIFSAFLAEPRTYGVTVRGRF